MQTPSQQFVRLLRYAAPYRARVILAVACLFLIALLNAISIGSLQPIFDGLFGAASADQTISLPAPVARLLGGSLQRIQAFLREHQIGVITFIGGILFFVFVAKGALMYLQQILMRSVSERVKKDIRNDLYGHLQTLSLGFYTRRSTGELMSRLTFDIESLGGAATDFFRNALREPLNIIGLLILLFMIKWQLALLSLVVLPCAILPIVKFGKKIRTRGLRMHERRATLDTILEETISGVRIVKAFAMEDYERGRFAKANEAVFHAMMRVVKVDALTSPVLEILGAIGIALAVWVGGYLVYSHALSPGAFMAFLGALASLYQPVKRLSQIHNDIQRGLAGVSRVFELMDTQSEVVERPDALTLGRMQEGVQFHNLSFGYGPERVVLQGISFSAKLGEIVAIVGSSGAGKTTLLNLLPRFYDPTGGFITIDGVEISRVTIRSLREQMGIVTQDTILFDDTVFNNIAYGQPGVAPDQVVEAARIANAEEFIATLPEGYQTRIGERGVRLSGGQKQRIAIARAILKNPPLLILDEATSALDAESERLVQEALDRLMQNRTSFVIAHRLSTIIRADKILVLDGGRLVEQGTHAELMARRGAYWRLYETQQHAA
ncbi:MAG: ABC transporter ATP-binding protein [Candidatus Methylomirabilis sp.]